ncbi:MAG: sigma 54-interacting transcriptional regulator [Candidatus Latescibacterota bacterium]|nr:MAG: sigma 54-interacting transcriptional regulator [Candidatus Latescibacterota bacterium]
MPDQIIDSKFRVLETLPNVAGRQRSLVSDLISGRMAVLESVPLEGFERLQRRWSQYWQPALRERASRFGRLQAFVPVTSAGAWKSGAYYVFEDDSEDAAAKPDLKLPSVEQVRALIADIQAANALGDHVLNLRPEFLRLRDDRLQLLPGAWILPFELLSRAGPRCPHQAPEVRYAGHLGPTSDGYTVASVLQALAERASEPSPAWWNAVLPLSSLEAHRRPSIESVVSQLADGAPVGAPAPTPRRSVERLADLAADIPSAGWAWPALFQELDAGLTHLAEAGSTLLLVEAPSNGVGLPQLFLQLRENLALLAERPHVARIDAFTSWEVRDLVGRGPKVLLVPDFRPLEPQLLPLEPLLQNERLRPAVWVIGVRRGTLPRANGDRDMQAWVREVCNAEVRVVRCESETEAVASRPAPPTSPAARHLLDLISVLETDATDEMLRMALPQEEADLPEALAELETLGHLRRTLEPGGWWGAEPRLVFRILCPDALELRRQGLTVHRREELHLLISHLFEDVDAHTLAQRYLRFHHLFAGGNWDAAAAECGPLLRWVQRRGLDTLMRQIQRKLVNSNLAQHFTVPHLLEVLRSLGDWEVQRNRVAEGQSYYERAAEKLFSLAEEDAEDLDLAGTSDMLLAHADLLERHGEFEHALELLQRYLDRFDERIPAVERGRLLSEMAFCEYRLGRFGSAEERSHVALKLLDSRRHPQFVAQVYSILGLVRWKTSRYDEAEQYFNSSLGLREKSGDRLAIARTYNNLGLLCRSRRRFPKALEYHRKSMEIRQELGDETGVARIVLNLAWVHFEMNDLLHAEELAQRAYRLSDELGSRSLRAGAQGLLGEVYLSQERMNEARAALEDAIVEARDVGDVTELFMDLRKQASLELRDGNLARAEELLRESEQHLPRAGSPLEEANWHLTHGELRTAQGDLRSAALSYEHAGNNLARLGHAQRAADVFVIATRLYHQSGVAGRARDLVVRARQLYGREGAVVPKELVDLEAAVGESDHQRADTPETSRTVDSLLRTCASAATSGSDITALEQILSEMRTCGGARCALLVGVDGELHRASVLSRELQDQGVQIDDLVQARPRLLSRALQTLLPLSSQELPDEEARFPFYAIPVEAREHGLGCIFLEWDEGTTLPGEDVLRVLRAMTQLVALVLERSWAPAPTPASADAATEPRDETSLDNIVGRSAARQAMIDFIRQVRDLDATVLLLGENGTGKEVVARAIHFTGVRRNFPFVTVNCNAIPEALWESELFGHERGAFTDAHETKRGYFETAHRGTLLLDEIGDMPWEMQTKFLRVLEEKSFTRIGGTESRHVDVRIVSATNQDLQAAVQAGRFRADLYHRLNVLSITLPPLRERREDIPELVSYFLELHAKRLNARHKRLSGEALRVLMRYPWPGNVRELENAMKGSLVLSEREVLVPEDLPAAILKGGDGSEIAGELDLESVARWVLDHAAYSTNQPLMNSLEKALARQLVEKIGEKTQAAKLLGISRPTLYERLRERVR